MTRNLPAMPQYCERTTPALCCECSLSNYGRDCRNNPVYRPADEPLDVSEAKALLENAAANHGQAAHDRYAGACRQDRNDAVVAIQCGADPDEVIMQMWGE